MKIIFHIIPIVLTICNLFSFHQTFGMEQRDPNSFTQKADNSKSKYVHLREFPRSTTPMSVNLTIPSDKAQIQSSDTAGQNGDNVGDMKSNITDSNLGSSEGNATTITSRQEAQSQSGPFGNASLKTDENGTIANNTTSGQNITNSGQDVANSGQNITNSGQNVTNSGQNVTNSGQNVTNSGQNVTNSGQKISNYGQNVASYGQNITISGQNITISGQNITISGQTIANSAQNIQSAVAVTPRASRGEQCYACTYSAGIHAPDNPIECADPARLANNSTFWQDCDFASGDFACFLRVGYENPREVVKGKGTVIVRGCGYLRGSTAAPNPRIVIEKNCVFQPPDERGQESCVCASDKCNNMPIVPVL